MDWLWYLLLIVLQFVGLFVNILGMPGLWIMVLSTATFTWITWDQGYVSVPSLVVLFVLAVLAEVVEFLAGSAGAKKAGASGWGQVGAIAGGVIGAIIGTPIFPIVGTIVGACAGSFAGSMFVEWYRRGEVDHAARVGWGAAKGRFLGILAKTGFGLIILLMTVIVAWPTGATPSANAAPVAPAPSTKPATPATLPVLEQETNPTTQPWW